VGVYRRNADSEDEGMSEMSVEVGMTSYPGEVRRISNFEHTRCSDLKVEYALREAWVSRDTIVSSKLWDFRPRGRRLLLYPGSESRVGAILTLGASN
jgi:hypothetical protein